MKTIFFWSALFSFTAFIYSADVETKSSLVRQTLDEIWGIWKKYVDTEGADKGRYAYCECNDYYARMELFFGIGSIEHSVEYTILDGSCCKEVETGVLRGKYQYPKRFGNPLHEDIVISKITEEEKESIRSFFKKHKRYR